MTIPSSTPGLSSTSFEGPQRRAIAAAWLRSRATSSPTIAAGTVPKFESAE